MELFLALLLLILFCTLPIVLFIIIPEKRKRNPENYQVVLVNFVDNDEKCYVAEFKNIFGQYKPLREFPGCIDEGDVLRFASYKDAANYIDNIVYKDKYKKL